MLTQTAPTSTEGLFVNNFISLDTFFWYKRLHMENSNIYIFSCIQTTYLFCFKRLNTCPEINFLNNIF